MISALTRLLAASVAPPGQPTIVDLAIKLLDSAPDWNADGYRLWHKAGACLWTANQGYGLALGITDAPHLFLPGAREAIRLTKRDKKRLWLAVKRFKSRKGDGKDAASATLLAERIVRLYDTDSGRPL